LVQTPIDGVSAHERQAPVQAVAQQTPWAQLPDRQSVPIEQEPPFIALPQELALQTLGAAQFASDVQAV
jgi:hypothetical protein